MPKIIEAIYEDGVFKPLEKVELKDGERVTIKIDDLRIKRLEFIKNWRTIDLGRRVTQEEIKRLKVAKYEDLL
uniref:Antitoxin n=1 Tax=Archaeoglobus fulgidus TaxID=2234 RepID=A0A7J3M3K7_ARCFL